MRIQRKLRTWPSGNNGVVGRKAAAAWGVQEHESRTTHTHTRNVPPFFPSTQKISRAAQI